MTSENNSQQTGNNSENAASHQAAFSPASEVPQAPLGQQAATQGSAKVPTPSAAAPVTDSVSAGPTIAAFFDVDNTIIRGASSFYLAKALYRRGFFKTSDIAEFAVKQLRYVMFGENKNDIDEVRSRALSLMKGHSVAEVIAVGEEVYDQVLANRIYEGTQKLIDSHLADGHQVWLVTATPSEIGHLIARRLGATGALSTTAESKDGFYTGRLVGDMMHGQAKADAVQALAQTQAIDLTQSFAYGDSTHDIPMLNAVGNPCPINPDKRMRRHAQNAGWPVRDFRAKRKAAKRGIQTASVTGGVWVTALVIKRFVAKFSRR